MAVPGKGDKAAHSTRKKVTEKKEKKHKTEKTHKKEKKGKRHVTPMQSLPPATSQA